MMPSDVLILTCDDVDRSLFDRLSWSEGDRIVTRPGIRTPSHKVDADTADLLTHFRSPRTVLQAVFRHSLICKRDATETLHATFPVLSKLIQAQILVPSGSPTDASASANSGVIPLPGFDVVKRVQSLNDTEVYQVRGRDGDVFALKISREGSRSGVAILKHEERILRRLNDVHNARLISSGMHDGKKYLLMDWCEGPTAGGAAGKLRSRGWSSRSDLLNLCCDIVGAYVSLHEQGIVHADVHPRNIIVESDKCIKLIDFGLANVIDRRTRSVRFRAGVAFYFEPEYVRAIRRGEKGLAATPLGEQYQVGALLYFLLTGHHYLQFSLYRNDAYEQIVFEYPRRFLDYGAPAWPEVENVLARALQKEPGERFGSMAEFGEHLKLAAKSRPVRVGSISIPNGKLRAKADFVSALIARYKDPGGYLLSRSPCPPSCSVNYGAAGIAYMFYRIGCAEGSPKLLTAADLWCAWALKNVNVENAFTSRDYRIRPEIVGNVSLYHSIVGIHCVRALIQQSIGSMGELSQSIEAFVLAASYACDNVDVTLGRASTLLGTALIIDALEGDQRMRPRLQQFGDGRFRELCNKIECCPPIGDSSEIRQLGIAHGWAGLLYSLMLWCTTNALEVPAWVRSRLHELTNACDGFGGAGRRWSGWCRGAAGFVYLWTQAYQVFADELFLKLAQDSATDTWCRFNEGSANLCCGLAGQAYALMRMHRITGEAVWLKRARYLQSRALVAACSNTLIPGSLYKGDVGVAVLTADLERPDSATMPLFEPEQ